MWGDGGGGVVTHTDLGVCGQIVVEDDVDVGDIETARGDVCCNEDCTCLGLKRCKGTETFGLQEGCEYEGLWKVI